MTTMQERVLLVESGAATGARVRPAAVNGSGGYEFVEVSGEETFAIALSAGEFDVILTEEELGWTMGQDVLRRVKGVRPEVPVILLQESADVSMAVEAMRAGFEDCVALDAAGLDRMGETIHAALARSRDHLQATRRTSSLEGTLQRLQVAFFRLSSEGEILKANRTCLDLLGLRTPAEARRFRLHDHVFHRDVAQGLDAELKRDGRIALTEVLVRRADGVAKRVCISESTGTTSLGEAIVDGILLEPSKQLGDQVPMAAAARVHVTLASLPSILAILDRYGHIVWIQGRDLGAMGIDPAGCVGRMLTTVGRTGGNVMDDVSRALGGEEVLDTLRVDNRMFRVRMCALRGARAVAPEVAMMAMEVSATNGGACSQTRVHVAAPAVAAAPASAAQPAVGRTDTAIVPAVPIQVDLPPPPAPVLAQAPHGERQEIAI